MNQENWMLGSDLTTSVIVRSVCITSIHKTFDCVLIKNRTDHTCIEHDSRKIGLPDFN